MLLFTHSRQVGFALSMMKLKEEIRFHDHPNSAIDIVDNTSWPVTTKIDGKFISGRDYSPCFNRFLLNVQCYNEINQWLTLLEVESYAHMDYGKRDFFKRQTQSWIIWLWAKIIRSIVTGEN